MIQRAKEINKRAEKMLTRHNGNLSLKKKKKKTKPNHSHPEFRNLIDKPESPNNAMATTFASCSDCALKETHCPRTVMVLMY